MNRLFLDTETTGLDKKENGIITMAYTIEDGAGTELIKRELKMNTFLYKPKYSTKALEVNGETLASIKSYGHPKEALQTFMDDLLKFYDGSKYKVVAYNGHFDVDFLYAVMEHYFKGWFWHHVDFRVCDPFKVISILHHEGLYTIDNGDKTLNLESVANFFGIEIEAHNVVSDKEATVVLYKRILEVLRTADWSKL